MAVEVAGRSATGPPGPAPSEGGHAARDLVWLGAILVVLAVVVPLLIAGHYGAFGIPRSDDWSYLLVQFRFAGHQLGRPIFNILFAELRPALKFMPLLLQRGHLIRQLATNFFQLGSLAAQLVRGQTKMVG